MLEKRACLLQVKSQCGAVYPNNSLLARSDVSGSDGSVRVVRTTWASDRASLRKKVFILQEQAHLVVEVRED
jgi:hypothetical protein